MKFNIGDKVRVKSEVEINATLNEDNHARYFTSDGSFHFIYFAEEMYDYCGRVFTISKICENESYKLAERDGKDWNFIDDWLELTEITDESCYVSSFTEVPREKIFIDKILGMEEDAKQCLDTDCSDCDRADCIFYDLIHTIREYRGTK